MLLRIGIAATTLMLVACGGGSGNSNSNSNSNNNPPQATAQDLANAKAAAVVGRYDLTNHMMTLAWSDAFAAGTSFQIEQQQSDGSWSKIDSVPGPGGSATALTWTRAVNATSTLRIEAVLGGYNVPLQTAGGQQNVVVTPPGTPPTLVFGATQPISVQTGLSLANAGTYTTVSYSVDGNSIGSTTIGPDYRVTLDPTGLVAGAHQIQAQLALNADVSLTLEQQVMLASPELGIGFFVDPGTLQGIDPAHITGSLLIIAQASSDFGVTSVSAAIDGKPIGSLSAPNFCNRGCQLATGGEPKPSDLNSYSFAFDTIALGSGLHVLSVSATDGRGASGEVLHQYTFNNPPVLTLSAPFDGALVNGSLTVSGTATSDKPGAITTVATINGTQILSSLTSPFSTNYSLNGLAAGDYTVVVTTTDGSGATDQKQVSITVTSAPALVYAPVIVLGTYGKVLAAEGPNFVYRRVRDIARSHSGTSDVALPHTPAYTMGQSFLSNGKLFVTANSGSGDPARVYMVAADGTLTSLSDAAGTGTGDALVAVHGAIVAFRNGAGNSLINGGNSYTLYNVDTAAKLTVPTPAGATAITASGDFYTTSSGNVVFFYPAITSASPTTDMFRWDQTTGQSTHVTNGGGTFQLDVQTDGKRAAWSSAPPAAVPFNSIPVDLVSLDIASNTAITVSNIADIPLQIPYMRDGLLVWKDSAASGGGIKVSDGASTTTLTARLSSVLFGTGGGYVLYEDQGALYVWSAAGGSKLIFDAVPGMAMISQKTVYFTNGLQAALYQVTLQ